MYLVLNGDHWYGNINRLVTKPAVCREMSKEGRQLVQQRLHLIKSC